MLRRCGLVVSMLVACTAPEPVAEVPAWLRSTGERAPVDLPEKPGDPRWRVLTSIPECDAHLAAEPAKLGLTLEWRPCATGKPGCRELVPPYVDSLFGRLDISLLAATTARGVQVLIFEPNGGPERQRISLAPLDGPPFVVFDLKSYGGKCSFVNALFAADSAAVALIRDATIDDNETIWFAGPLRADPAWHEPAARVLVPVRSSSFGGMSLVGRSLVQHHGEGVRRSDPAAGSFLPVQPAPGMHAGFAIGASFVYATRDRIVVAGSPGAPPIPLHTSPEGAEIGPVYLEDARLFWALGYGKDQVRRFDRIELWTAPATDDPGKFTARKLADTSLRIFEDLDSLRAGDGMVAYREFDEQARVMRALVVDVASGQRRTWLSGDDVPPSQVLFVDRDELGLHVTHDDRGSGYLRVRLDALDPL